MYCTDTSTRAGNQDNLILQAGGIEDRHGSSRGMRYVSSSSEQGLQRQRMESSGPLEQGQHDHYKSMSVAI